MFDIIGKRNWFFAFSLAIMIPGLIFLILGPITGGKAGLQFAIDFTGGTVWTIRFEDENVTPQQVKEVIAGQGIEASVTQTGDGFMEIRTREAALAAPEPSPTPPPTIAPSASASAAASASAVPSASHRRPHRRVRIAAPRSASAVARPRPHRRPRPRPHRRPHRAVRIAGRIRVRIAGRIRVTLAHARPIGLGRSERSPQPVLVPRGGRDPAEHRQVRRRPVRPGGGAGPDRGAAIPVHGRCGGVQRPGLPGPAADPGRLDRDHDLDHVPVPGLQDGRHGPGCAAARRHRGRGHLRDPRDVLPASRSTACSSPRC